MKFSRILWLVLLIGFSSVVAKADSVPPDDPRIAINAQPGDATIYTGVGPLQLTYSAAGFALDFIYEPLDGVSPLNALTVDLIDVPAITVPPLSFQCFSNVWIDCTLFADITTYNSSANTITYVASYNDTGNGGAAGSSGPCLNGPTAGLACPGFLSPDQTFTASLIPDPTPEPSTVLLFATGLLGLFGLRRKKFFAAASAV